MCVLGGGEGPGHGRAGTIKGGERGIEGTFWVSERHPSAKPVYGCVQASVERLSRQFAEGAAAMIEEQRRATGEATAAQREESRRQQAAYMNDLAALNREVDAYRNEAQAAGGTLHSAIERVNARWGEGGQGRVGHKALWGMISARVLQ